MTQLEQELAALGKLALRQYIRKDEIDWEQRRYETAKDIMCAAIASGKVYDTLVDDAIGNADELIKRLKTT